MPSRTGKAAAKPPFELPALDLNLGNITDGTNIPPPPDSPVRKVSTPPRTPPALEKPRVGASQQLPKANGTQGNETLGASDKQMSSPTSSARQGSLRRFFSRNRLNNEFADGELPANSSVPVLPDGRPQSRSGFSLMDDRKSKRYSGWFKRLRNGDQQPSRRSSFLFGSSSTSPTKHSGPPPPMIPELKELEKDDGSLGTDIFKNIKNIS
jgi:hypothetical protein